MPLHMVIDQNRRIVAEERDPSLIDLLTHKLSDASTSPVDRLLEIAKQTREWEP